MHPKSHLQFVNGSFSSLHWMFIDSPCLCITLFLCPFSLFELLTIFSKCQRSRLRVRLMSLTSHENCATVFLRLSRWKEFDCGVGLIGCVSWCVCVCKLSEQQQCISIGLMWKLSIFVIQTTMLHGRLLPLGK